jgi:uncharacterized spore protein YtfJ
MSGQQKAFEKTEISFVERLAQQIGITANAKYIYAEPIERDGVTVIPVAKAVYGFGGGSGKKENEQGAGGGGGAVLTPVGYIEIKDGATRFRPTRDAMIYVSLIAAVAPLVMFAVWRLTNAFRTEK